MSVIHNLNTFINIYTKCKMHAKELIQKRALEIATRRFFKNHAQPLRYIDVLFSVGYPQISTATPS
jgi:hypothetical protein